MDEIEADVAVVTPGAWASHLLPGIPVAATAQTVAYYPRADDGASWPTFIEWTDRGFAWYEVPSSGGAPGVKVGEHRPGPRVDPAEGPFEPDADALAATTEYARRRFPGLIASPVHAETCLYEMTPDERFVLDRRGPIVVGTGGSGHAFKFTPLLGEILADLAQGSPPAVPIERFSPSRFGS